MGEATISVIIFVIVMIVIITEKINRAVVAVGGAVLLFITGVLTVDSGAGYIDYNTIGVLVGMMLFVSVVKNSGLFEYMAIKAAKVAKGSPAKMMVIFVVITAVLSCMLDNVTTVLLIGPMTFAITRELEINPVPYIITQILASNIGGTATLIGDPPNIMIGSAAGLTFMDFIANNGIIIAVVLAVTILCFLFIFRKDFSVSSHHISRVMAMDERELIKDRALLHKSVVMIVLVALGFIFHGNLGVDSSVIALAAAIIMMIIGRQPAEDTILDVEWTTIIFFVALFVVVGGMVETGVIDRLANIIVDVTGGEMVMAMLIILWVSALLSSTLDNIPFVATMVPLIASMGESGMDVMPLWWALSLGACLGGNGTIIGASANVVLTGISAKNGHPISYMQFLKVGFPMMIISIILCTGYLLLKYA
ncbi:MAG TPA: ArsB/NhaD family transporter [Candidatus Copromorpha excrementigallinarum]|uniref:ArsB/NhaD family transporter n=1 Tax=Candidatus Allocopromorpha excrementigallinarum TaxID=2840742 RepID=A0A9D1I281_9FIRM|nr:ArsB/NhaD family transporter [Candidatus Copromorpha excrementigallinarum]